MNYSDLIAEGKRLWAAATPGRWTVHDMGDPHYAMDGDSITSENDSGWWWVWQESALPGYGGVLEATREKVSDNDPPGRPIGLAAITDNKDGERERADAELIVWMRNNLLPLFEGFEALEAAQHPEPRHWVRARDIPYGVTVTAYVYSSDSRMRWRRCESGEFAQSYPGSPDVTVTAEEMDARFGGVCFVEVQP